MLFVNKNMTGAKSATRPLATGKAAWQDEYEEIGEGLKSAWPQPETLVESWETA